MSDGNEADYTYQPERNRYTASGRHGAVTVYKLSEMTAEEIAKHGLEKYVTQHDG